MQKLDSSLSRVNGLEEPVYPSVVTSFSKTFKTSNTYFAFNISLKIFPLKAIGVMFSVRANAYITSCAIAT